MLIPPDTDIFFRGEASEYACNNWCDHFDQWLILGNESHDDPLTSYLKYFVSESFGYWVNTLLIKGLLGNMIDMLHRIWLKLKVSFLSLRLGNGLTICIPATIKLLTRPATDNRRYPRACKGIV
jgi:hypothetical protein